MFCSVFMVLLIGEIIVCCIKYVRLRRYGMSMMVVRMIFVIIVDWVF